MQKLIFTSTTIALLILIPAFASGEVYIPDHEYVGFYDHDGIFTVIAGVKNNEMQPVIPTITVTVNDDDNVFSQEYKFSPVMPAQMLPLKLKLPQITSENPVLELPQISFEITEYKFEGGYVLYDDSLILHDDGRMTGKIKNAGEQTFQNFRVYALIKDENENILDVASSQKFDLMQPGDILEFEMIPHPEIADKISLYSCFAFGGEEIFPLNAERNGEQYTFRYESGAWFTDSQFNPEGTELSMYTFNSWHLDMNASLEFPQSSVHEDLEVYLDNEKVQSLLSIDEMGNWHVYFTVPNFYQGNTVITGFKQSDGTVMIPEEIDITTLVITQITDGKVTRIIADTMDTAIVIELETTKDGILSITTSDFLIRPFSDGNFFVLIDGEEVEQITFENKILTIPYSAGTEKVEVYGSYVVPEFGAVAIFILGTAIISIIVLFRKHSLSYSLSKF
jgi:predicted secreted protein with PEFG-CTERM motif|tara:strand:- start:124 stop:1476 length:1353 start_codon:yes stop_codon:yes gene_type:complete